MIALARKAPTPFMRAHYERVALRYLSSEGELRESLLGHDIDCTLAGPDNIMLRSVVFRPNRDNQELGIFSQNELKLAPPLR